MSSPEIKQVRDQTAIDTVAMLADEIWHRHFVPIIGREQVDYMLDKFQSATAVAGQIKNGYEYYLIYDGPAPAGYFCLVPPAAEKEAQLSKLYLLKHKRGTGLGCCMLAFCEQRARQLESAKLWLTVNRHNHSAIGFYEHNGFIKSGTLVQDIGQGYVMDDYIMEKAV